MFCAIFRTLLDKIIPSGLYQTLAFIMFVEGKQIKVYRGANTLGFNFLKGNRVHYVFIF